MCDGCEEIMEIMLIPCTLCAACCGFLCVEVCDACCEIRHSRWKDKMKGTTTSNARSRTSEDNAPKTENNDDDNATNTGATTTTAAATISSTGVETEEMERPFEKATMAFPQ